MLCSGQNALFALLRLQQTERASKRRREGLHSRSNSSNNSNNSNNTNSNGSGASAANATLLAVALGDQVLKPKLYCLKLSHYPSPRQSNNPVVS
jgi:hypothetical protein